MKTDINIEEAKRSCNNYYDQVSEEYFEKFSDELSNKIYDVNFLKNLIQLLDADARILDIGCCSSAQQARFFRNKGFHVTSIDISKKCIKKAKAYFKDIEFLQMDMLSMTFDDKSFDAINAFYSIIHIPDEKLDELFFGFNRILKIKGKIALAVHTGNFYGYEEENGVQVFYRTFSKEQLLKQLERFNFRTIELDQREPVYSFEFQSDRIYLIAEKTGDIHYY